MPTEGKPKTPSRSKPTKGTSPARPVRKTRSLPTIGWREWVALPQLGVGLIRAKVDTGARTAALHAFGLEIIDRNGVQTARFAIHPEHRSTGPAVVTEAPVIATRTVKSSSGDVEVRPVIQTVLQIGKHKITAEVSLTRRDEMGLPMLLGRQTIRRRFLVDPGRSYLVGTPPEPTDRQN